MTLIKILAILSPFILITYVYVGLKYEKLKQDKERWRKQITNAVNTLDARVQKLEYKSEELGE